jgi:hypothetical protein
MKEKWPVLPFKYGTSLAENTTDRRLSVRVSSTEKWTSFGIRFVWLPESLENICSELAEWPVDCQSRVRMPKYPTTVGVEGIRPVGVFTGERLDESGQICRKNFTPTH